MSEEDIPFLMLLIFLQPIYKIIHILNGKIDHFIISPFQSIMECGVRRCRGYEKELNRQNK